MYILSCGIFISCIYNQLNFFSLSNAIKPNSFIFALVSSTKCHRWMDSLSNMCVNPTCAASNDPTSPLGGSTEFNLMLSLSDHTGTLNNLRVSNAAAMNMFNCIVSLL